MVCSDCEKLVIEVADLKKRLLAYENSNTPPALSRRKRKPREPTGNPRGAPKGHEGTTRAIPEPDKTVDVAPLKNCANCKKPLDEPDGFLDRLITEFPFIPELFVTLFRLPIHTCKNCGAENIASHPNCPEKGLFGYNILALVAMLKHKARLPYRKVSEILESLFHLKITPATALELDTKVAAKLLPEYEKLKGNAKESNHLNIDETGANINGKRHNTWVFTNEDVTLLVTRKSRSKKVLVEILGENYDGIIGCDGHKAYSNFTRFLQRCWAHILRELEHLSEKLPQAIPLHKELQELYGRLASKYRKRMSKKQRYSLWAGARYRLRQILKKYWCKKKLAKILMKIRNGFEHWFTFILHPEIEPTNNKAERGIRETVVQRKIYGCLRNQKGMNNHDILTSLIATWKQRGLNPYNQMLTTLRS